MTVYRKELALNTQSIEKMASSESGTEPQADTKKAPEGARNVRKWSPEEYTRRGISRERKVHLSANVLPATREKAERMATAGRITLSALIELLVKAADE